jgi:hypothetical protein
MYYACLPGATLVAWGSWSGGTDCHRANVKQRDTSEAIDHVPKAPIWERLAAIGAAVPADAWTGVPSDLAANVDEWLYGQKKDASRK